MWETILKVAIKHLLYLLLTVAFNTIVGLYLLINYYGSVALFGKLLLIPGNISAILAFYLRRKFDKN